MILFLIVFSVCPAARPPQRGSGLGRGPLPPARVVLLVLVGFTNV